MKKHTLFGWEVLHKADRELGEQSFLTLAATIALSHHERYDGNGYPDGDRRESRSLFRPASRPSPTSTTR